MGNSQSQLKIVGTERKKLPDLVNAAEIFEDAKANLAEAKGIKDNAEIALRVLCAKYVESGGLEIEEGSTQKGKVPVYIYQVQDGDNLVTRRIKYGFEEKVSTEKVKRSTIEEDDRE